MTTDEESLKIIIEEQRRDYDYLVRIYDRMRATESILLTATFGILAYLYYGTPDGADKTGITERLFIPTEDYGKVIYFIAAGFFAYGLLRLMLTVFGDNPWETTYEIPKTDYKDKISTLKYVKKRHDTCIKRNGAAYEKRRQGLKFLFYCILISAIILIVIKTLN